MPKTSSIHASVSIQYRLEIDTPTDTQTRTHSHRSIANTALPWRRAGKSEDAAGSE